MGAMVATVRANVKAWECDVMAHMNVQHYLARSSETVGQLQVLLGLSAAPELALLHRAERVLFMRELHNGETYTVSTGIFALAGSRLTSFSEMLNLESNAIAARFVVELELVDMARGVAVELPQYAHQAAQALMVEPPADLRPPAVLPQPPRRDLATALHYNLIDTACGTIEPWECDLRGELHPRFFMSRCSDAVTHLQRHYGLTPAYRKANGLGSAALEYNIEFQRPLRAGDALITKSGLREMHSKTQRFFHWFFHAASGATAATVETTGTLFDVETRTAIAMPPDLRARAEPLFVRF